MKQNLSPTVIIGVIVAVVVVVGLIGFWVWRAPSVTAAPGVSQNAPPGPREGGGPTAEDLKKRDEYYRTHPDAAGSRPGMR
jgi:hypothetical protein